MRRAEHHHCHPERSEGSSSSRSMARSLRQAQGGLFRVPQDDNLSGSARIVVIQLFLLASLFCYPIKAAEFPSIKAILNERTAKIEKDLANRMMRRGDPKSAGLPLESQIDLRVIQRWLLNQAANAKPESDVQV